MHVRNDGTNPRGLRYRRPYRTAFLPGGSYDVFMETAPTYREVQRFRQWWLWALLAGSALFTTALGPLSWSGLATVGAVAVLVYSLRLVTEVRDDGIYIKMWPLHRSFRRIPWSEVERYESRRYSPLREFGGWGVRWRPGKIAYNVSGDRGLWIERTDDRSILVGSRNVEQLTKAVDSAYDG